MLPFVFIGDSFCAGEFDIGPNSCSLFASSGQINLGFTLDGYYLLR